MIPYDSPKNNNFLTSKDILISSKTKVYKDKSVILSGATNKISNKLVFGQKMMVHPN
jgi:hypothetical protein